MGRALRVAVVRRRRDKFLCPSCGAECKKFRAGYVLHPGERTYRFSQPGLVIQAGEDMGLLPCPTGPQSTFVDHPPPAAAVAPVTLDGALFPGPGPGLIQASTPPPPCPSVPARPAFSLDWNLPGLSRGAGFQSPVGGAVVHQSRTGVESPGTVASSPCAPLSDGGLGGGGGRAVSVRGPDTPAAVPRVLGGPGSPVVPRFRFAPPAAPRPPPPAVPAPAGAPAPAPGGQAAPVEAPLLLDGHTLSSDEARTILERVAKKRLFLFERIVIWPWMSVLEFFFFSNIRIHSENLPYRGEDRCVPDRHVECVKAPMRLVHVEAATVIPLLARMLLGVIVSVLGLSVWGAFKQPLGPVSSALVLWCEYTVETREYCTICGKLIFAIGLLLIIEACHKGRTKVHVAYVPHILTSVLREFPLNTQPEVARQHMRAKMLRLACLPVRDRDCLQYYCDTELVCEVLLETQGFWYGGAH